nr:MAG TPA: hypothetical protein [Caudoviricetes sp.]
MNTYTHSCIDTHNVHSMDFIAYSLWILYAPL